MTDERGRTLNEVIDDLEQLRRKHGGPTEVFSSAGGVGFKFVTFSQEEREREGVRDFIQVVGADSLGGARRAVSEEKLDDWHYELVKIESGLRAIETTLIGFDSYVKEEWARTQITGLVSLLGFSAERLEKVMNELG